MEFGWKMVLGSLIGFFGASFGSVGGVGGGGIFVPMLTLIIGFDPKSSTAMSKCENLSVSLRDSSFVHALKEVAHAVPTNSFAMLCLVCCAVND
jgi:uncharacterized membrane protein YfcA